MCILLIILLFLISAEYYVFIFNLQLPFLILPFAFFRPSIFLQIFSPILKDSSRLIAGKIPYLVVLFISLLLFFHISLGFVTNDYIIDYIRVLISILLSFCIYQFVRKGIFNLKNLRSFIIFSFFVFIFIISLEIFTPFRDYLYLINSTIYKVLPSSQSFFESRSVSRALGFFGIRPLFFFTEPSFVGLFVLNLSFLLILVDKFLGFTFNIITVLLLFLSSLLVSSPIAYSGFLLLFVSYFSYLKSASVKIFFICASFVVAGFGLNWFFQFRPALANIASLYNTPLSNAHESSEFIRLIVPLKMLQTAIQTNNWLFGLGLDIKGIAFEFIDWLKYIPEYAIVGNNSLFKIGLIYGLFGYLFLAYLVIVLYKILLPDKTLARLFVVYIFLLLLASPTIDSFFITSSIGFFLGFVNNSLSRPLFPSQKALR